MSLSFACCFDTSLIDDRNARSPSATDVPLPYHLCTVDKRDDCSGVRTTPEELSIAIVALYAASPHSTLVSDHKACLHLIKEEDVYTAARERERDREVHDLTRASWQCELESEIESFLCFIVHERVETEIPDGEVMVVEGRIVESEAEWTLNMAQLEMRLPWKESIRAVPLLPIHS